MSKSTLAKLLALLPLAVKSQLSPLEIDVSSCLNYAGYIYCPTSSGQSGFCCQASQINYYSVADQARCTG